MNNFKYELTIGMIFRDDIKYIRKCLETMQPLRDAIPCQLIMTDTGSTDGSRAVAEEFADVLLDFEWCDDFSAARNTGTAIAEGRWFAYFDTDQEFDESILEIVKFLKSKDSHKADNATVVLQDYVDERKFYTRDSTLLYNFSNGTREFRYRIHESILCTDSTKILPVKIKHWGYMGDASKTKQERNYPLLRKIIEEEPDELKHYHQLEREISDAKHRLSIINEGIAVGDKNKTHNFFYYFLHLDWLRVNAIMGNFEEFDKRDHPLETIYPNTSFYIDYLGVKYQRYRNDKDFDGAYKQFKSYKALMVKQNGKTDITDTMGIIFLNRQIDTFYEFEIDLINYAVLQGRFDEAKKLISASEVYQLRTANGESPYMINYLKFALRFDVYSQLNLLYLHAVKADDPMQLAEVQQLIDLKLSRLNQSELSYFLGHFTQIADSYTALLYIRYKNFDKSAFSKKIVPLITEEGFHLKPNNAQLLYGYIRTGQDPCGYLEKCDISLAVAQSSRLFEKFPDMEIYVEKTYNNPNFSIPDLKYEKLWAYLGCRCALQLAEKDEPDAKRISKLFSQAIPMMSNFVEKIYNPALFSEAGKGILPNEELFSIYASKAMEETNPLQYIRKLKEALEICPAYVPILKVLTAELQAPTPEVEEQTPETTTPPAEPKSEFNALGEQIKSTIKTLLANGDKAQAKLFLDKYKTIAPNDPDIPSLLEQV